MKIFRFQAKTCSYLTDDGSEDKQTKDTKNVSSKKPLNFKIVQTVQKHLKLKIK